MKMSAAILWAIAFAVGLHCWITLVTFPEFTIVDEKIIQNYLSGLEKAEFESKESVRAFIIKGQWNGQHGTVLAKWNLIIDGIIIFALVVRFFSLDKKLSSTRQP